MAPRSRRRERGTDVAVVGAGPTEAQSSVQVKKAESNTKKIAVRVIGGGLMVIYFNLLIWAGHLYVVMFVLLLQGLIFMELVDVRYKAAQRKNIPLFRTLQWCWFGAAAFYVYGDWLHEFCTEHRSMQFLLPVMRYHELCSMWFYTTAFVLSVLCMRPGCYKYQVGQLSWTIVSIMLIFGQMRFVTHNIFNGLFWFMYPSMVVITNDIMAYFSGLLLGRRLIARKFLSLSPNKTWEGYIGSVFFTMLFGYIMAGFLIRYPWLICKPQSLEFYLHPSLECAPESTFVVQNMTLPLTDYLHEIFPESVPVVTVKMAPAQIHGVALAAYASIAGPFGGFLASAVKRAYKVKDFNNLIPGHGGITDRMDCQLQMALFTWVYYSTFVRSNAVNPARLLALSTLLPKEELMLLYDDLGAHIRTLTKG